MDVSFNLDDQIAQLEQRYAELKAYPLDTSPGAPPIPAQQTRITAWLAQINVELVYLKNIRANRAAASVTVSPPTQQEEDNLNDALEQLSIPIQRNEAFGNLLAAVTSILNAAGTIAGKA